ncbi:MAG: transposase [Rhodocyclaceae bacterium]|nr:transposase [Rhodocyclaceae bacterium]
MSRPLRLEFCGALYHVTSRGDRREDIYDDDEDRERFLEILGGVVSDFNWVCHAYCLMDNHYHLLIATPDGNLAKGMRQLNGVYTQASNRRHRRGGHLFQGRYKAILVDEDAYLLEVARYVVLNPLRAGMVSAVEAWPWSSYLAMLGEAPRPEWLTVDAVLGQFGKRRATAREKYARFVAEGRGLPPIWNELNRQVFLGDDAFVLRARAALTGASDNVNIPAAQRRPPPPPLASFLTAGAGRDAAMAAAHATGEYSYQQIGEAFGVHFTTVGRAVRAAKAVGRR